MAQCLTPIRIRNPHFEKSVGENASLIEEQNIENPLYYVYVPCGHCVNCLKNKRSQWLLRLNAEAMFTTSNQFLTLTIAPEFYEDIYKDTSKYIRLFFERLRKLKGRSPRHFIISELGDDERYTHRLHFHGIFFNSDVTQEDVNKCWNFGWSKLLKFTNRTTSYVTKYLLKFQSSPGAEHYRPRIWVSNRPAIGSNFCNMIRQQVRDKDSPLVALNGHEFQLPRNFYNKIYTEDERVQRFIDSLLKPNEKESYFSPFYGEFRVRSPEHLEQLRKADAKAQLILKDFIQPQKIYREPENIKVSIFQPNFDEFLPNL